MICFLISFILIPSKDVLPTLYLLISIINNIVRNISFSLNLSFPLDRMVESEISVDVFTTTPFLTNC